MHCPFSTSMFPFCVFSTKCDEVNVVLDISICALRLLSFQNVSLSTFCGKRTFQEARDGRFQPLEDVFARYSWLVQCDYLPIVLWERISCATQRNPSWDDRELEWSTYRCRHLILLISLAARFLAPSFRQRDDKLDGLYPSEVTYACQIRPQGFYPSMKEFQMGDEFLFAACPRLRIFFGNESMSCDVFMRRF